MSGMRRVSLGRVVIPGRKAGMAAEVFATTHWSVVLSARGAEGDPANRALEELCRIYWPPLYAWLRRRGYERADAEDLVQSFFEKFLERDSLREVGREKGRFRSFLLASMQHHLLTARRNERTLKRGGGVPALALDDPAVAERCEAALVAAGQPETIFDRVWAETVLDRAARRLRGEFEAVGRGKQYDVFRQWLVREARTGEYGDVEGVLGMKEGAIAVAVYRMRQRFRGLVRAEVAQTVAVPSEIDDEMRHLLKTLMAG